MDTKDKIVEELYDAVMQALRESLEEQRRMIQNLNESDDDDLLSFAESNLFDEDMFLSLAEDKVLDAISESLAAIADDGDITINED